MVVGALRSAASCVGILGLVVLAAGCQTDLPPPYLIRATSDTVYLVAEQSGGASLRAPADPLDPKVPDTGGNSFTATTTPTAGPLSMLARLQGQAPPAAVRFEATSQKAYYLDLDQNMVGTVYVSNALSSGPGLESGTYRVAVRINGVLAGGLDFDLSVGAASKATQWIPVHYSFPLESRAILVGDKVSLEVTQLSGLSDLRIGTGGNHQSHARIQYYPFDPLGGISYLERHKLVIQEPDGNLSDAQFLALAEAASRAGAYDRVEPGLYYLRPPATVAVDGPGLALGAAFLAPLVWTSARSLPRDRSMAFVALLLLLSIALAGCAKKGGGPEADANSDLPPEARPRVDTKVEDIGSGTSGTGAPGAPGELVGTVRDWRNLTLGGAYVAILGTSNFVETDASGRFAFDNLTAGKYVLRVDAVDMRSLEEPVEVFSGKRTIVAVKMAPLDPSAPDRMAHLHDEWQGKAERVVIETKFTPDLSKAYLYSQPSGGAPFCAPWSNSGVDSRQKDVVCMWEIPMAIDAKVPPGAGAIDVTISWDGDATEMGVRAYNPSAGRLEPNATYLARAEGVPTRIAFFPNEADPGHQGFTNWIFTLYIPTSDPTTFAQKPIIEVGEVTVKAVAHRAIVPFEPGHPDLWGESGRIQLFEGATTSYGNTGGEMPVETTVFKPGKGLFVPGGTDRIEGKLTVERGMAGETGTGITFGLAYKPANVPAARWEEGLVDIPLQGSFPEYTFNFKVPAEHLDQPYQTASNVFFYPTADVYAYRGGTTFTLDATVFKRT